MIAPIERAEVPVAPDYEAAQSMLETVVGDGLSLFVLHNAGVTTDRVVAGLGPVLERHCYRLAEKDLDLIQDYRGQPKPRKTDSRAADVRHLRHTEGLHIDGRPNPSKPLTTAITMHLTTDGCLKGDFLEVSEEFALSGGFSLPGNTNELFDAGYVDTAILKPLLYEVVIGVGGLAVFRAAGRLPLAHRFTALKLPRSSSIIHAFSTSMLAVLSDADSPTKSRWL